MRTRDRPEQGAPPLVAGRAGTVPAGPSEILADGYVHKPIEGQMGWVKCATLDTTRKNTTLTQPSP